MAWLLKGSVVISLTLPLKLILSIIILSVIVVLFFEVLIVIILSYRLMKPSTSIIFSSEKVIMAMIPTVKLIMIMRLLSRFLLDMDFFAWFENL